MKVIIAGSRTFNNYGLLVKKCDKILQNYNLKDIEIVCGMCTGADLLGKAYAELRGIKVKEMPADWRNINGKPKSEIGIGKYGKYWKLAENERNKKMGEYEKL